MINQLSDNILETLTTEEKEVLQKIEEKITNLLQEMKDNRFDHLNDNDNNPLDFSQKYPDIIHSKNLTKSPYEIIVTVKAEVSEIDNKGNISDIKEVIEKYYHIPSKTGTDYKPHLDMFFEKFHKSIEGTCQELNALSKSHG